MKTTMLLALFVLGMSGTMLGQTKYEFAELVYNSGGDPSKIFLVQSGLPRQEIAVPKTDYNPKVHDNTPVFNYLPKMIEDGWEMVYINDQVMAVVIVLKRKKS